MKDGTLIYTLNKSLTFQTSQVNKIKHELNSHFDENERVWKQYGPQSLIALSNPLSDLHRS